MNNNQNNDIQRTTDNPINTANPTNTINVTNIQSNVGAENKSSLATAGMVLGILALVFCPIPGINILGLILGVIGLSLSLPAMLNKSKAGFGKAVAGLVCSVVAIGLVIIINVLFVAGVNELVDEINDEINTTQTTDNQATTTQATDISSVNNNEAVTIKTEFSDGVYRIGRDVEVGEYRAIVPEGSFGITLCSVHTTPTADSSDIDDETSINNSTEAGSQVLAVLKDSRYVHSQGCGTFTKI